MTNEAAERLRRSKTECVYGVDSRGAIKRQVDIATVINAYLAEHLCDDDEPITEDWLAREYKMQVIQNDVGHRCRANVGRVFVCVDLWLNDRVTVWMDTQETTLDAKNIKTRGQLRQLLRALGATP